MQPVPVTVYRNGSAINTELSTVGSHVLQSGTVPLHVVSKNEATLASCSFDNHGLILIIFGRWH